MRKPPGALAQTVDLGPLTLRADVQAGSVNAEGRTVDMVFSTGAPVLRFDWGTGQKYLETLSLKPADVRMDRLNAGAPFLNAHSAYDVGDVLGVVVDGSARIAKGAARATVRFSKRDAVEPVWQDIRDGILRNVSVGYRVHKYEQTDAADGAPMRRHATDWEPFEISAVPIGADAGAQVRADTKTPTNPCVILMRAGQRETSAMDEDTRVEPETTPDPTHQPADPGAPMLAVVPRSAVVTESERQAGIEAERERSQGITLAVRHAGFPSTVADKYINDGTTLERAQGAILAELGKLDRQGPRPGGVAVREVGGIIREVGDMGSPVRAGITNALLHRVAPEAFKLEELGRPYAGSTLLDLARYCLQGRGIRTTGMSRMELAGLALGLNTRGAMHTTSDFADILADVANKTLRQAYEEAPQTFGPITRRVEVPDFKMVNRVQLGEAPQLNEVLEHGEFTRGTIGQGKETFQLKTWGRVFGITRQALVNDDTNAFARLASMFGRAARNRESQLVWAEITGNPAMGDGNNLFDTLHGNISGGATAISVASIGLGREKMRRQTALDGAEFVNASPRYLIVPATLETLADQFVSTNLLASQSSSVNPFSGRLTVIAEPRLDAASTSVWYLAADVAQIGDMIELASLAGEVGPQIETRVGFDVDGLEVKCRLDAVAKIIDWRGFFRNSA